MATSFRLNALAPLLGAVSQRSAAVWHEEVTPFVERTLVDEHVRTAPLFDFEPGREYLQPAQTGSSIAADEQPITGSHRVGSEGASIPVWRMSGLMSVREKLPWE